jgi:hypothetical protein
VNDDATGNAAAQGRARDYYTELIEESRWLDREQALKRMTWFEDLEKEDKHKLLFEFEMMLKGLVCFGNPVNHPGARKKDEPAVSRDFKNELGIARMITLRAIDTGRELLEGKENSVAFRRYRDSIIARDTARSALARQDAPEQSLASLIYGLKSLLNVFNEALDSYSVSFRAFYSTIRAAEREIRHSTYFVPLPALEFRVEFDEISPLEMLTTIRGIKSDPARKVTSLVFLSITRLLKYIDSLSQVRDGDSDPNTLFGWLSAMRSDARALSVFLRRNAPSWFSAGFGEQFDKLSPAALSERFSDLEDDFAALKSLKELLVSIGEQLRLEQRGMFEQRLPSIGSADDLQSVAKSAEAASFPMRAFLQNAMVLLAAEFDPSLDGSAIFADFASAEARSERLRRDVWMFQQVLRAFIEKTVTSTKAADKWSGKNTFHFVREFVRYFRSMGYQLLRYSDYGQLDKFIHLMDRLKGGDVLEVQRFENVVSSCEDFLAFLDKTFDAVSQRQELKDAPFDRKEAARTLKLFLMH